MMGMSPSKLKGMGRMVLRWSRGVRNSRECLEQFDHDSIFVIGRTSVVLGSWRDWSVSTTPCLDWRRSGGLCDRAHRAVLVAKARHLPNMSSLRLLKWSSS